jgi:class 3 adenylate cyclase
VAHDVFISHSKKDKAVADAICAALESAAIPCWVAPRDVQPGRSFAGEITRAIQNSKVMVLIFSAHSNTSEQVLREVQLAVKNHVHIVQFRVEQVVPSDDFAYFLSTPHRLDAVSPPLAAHIERLTSALKTLLGEPALEIRHVLFIDIVGYSKLLMNDQRDAVHRLNNIVSATNKFRSAEADGKLTRLPTGDGMALVFHDTPEAPLQCAVEVAEALSGLKQFQVRMGIHSGPVNEVIDVNKQANLAGAGINIAQRVMDCGDAGHILLSRHVAEDLEHYERWKRCLHDLGEREVKHGVRVGLVNFYSGLVGNPNVPEKFRARSGKRFLDQRMLTGAWLSRRQRDIATLMLILAAAMVTVWLGAHLFSAISLTSAAQNYPKRSYEKAKWSKIYGADRLFPTEIVFHQLSGWNRKNLVVTGETDDGQLVVRLQNGEWKTSRPQKIAGAGGITACKMIDANRFICLRHVGRGGAELDLFDTNGSHKLGTVSPGSSLYALSPNIYCGMDERSGYWKYSGNVLREFEQTARESFVLRDDNSMAQVEDARSNKSEPMAVAEIRDITVLAKEKILGLWSTASGNCATVAFRDDHWYLVTEVTSFSWRNVPNKAWFVDGRNFVAIGSDKVARCVDGSVTLQNLEVGGVEYPANALTAIWGHDIDHYWAANLSGEIFYFDGKQWQLVGHPPELPGGEKFENLWIAPEGSVLAVTNDGVYALE